MKAPQQSPSPPLYTHSLFLTPCPHQILLLTVLFHLPRVAHRVSQAHHLRDGPGTTTVCGTWLWKFEFSTLKPRAGQSWLPLSESTGPTTALCLFFLVAKTSPPARPRPRPGMENLQSLRTPGVSRSPRGPHAHFSRTRSRSPPSCARPASEGGYKLTPRRGSPARGAGGEAQPARPGLRGGSGRVGSGSGRVRVGLGPGQYDFP